MNVFVLHGTFGNPYENWFGWLSKKLSDSGVTSFCPHLPTPNGQTFENWKKIIDSYVETGVINGDTVLIGHSSASVFLVKYLSKTDFVPKALITVCGFNGFISGLTEFDELNKGFYVTETEISEFKKLQIPTTCIFSENDPYLPIEQLTEFSDKVLGERLIIKDGGHFNTDAGYGSFDELLGFLLKK